MQSRWMSLVESVANVLVGYIVAVTTQHLVFPLFGLHATLSQNLMIGLIFTGDVYKRQAPLVFRNQTHIF